MDNDNTAQETNTEEGSRARDVVPTLGEGEYDTSKMKR